MQRGAVNLVEKGLRGVEEFSTGYHSGICGSEMCEKSRSEQSI